MIFNTASEANIYLHSIGYELGYGGGENFDEYYNDAGAFAYVYCRADYFVVEALLET